jgi:hypothetical protein
MLQATHQHVKLILSVSSADMPLRVACGSCMCIHSGMHACMDTWMVHQMLQYPDVALAGQQAKLPSIIKGRLLLSKLMLVMTSVSPLAPPMACLWQFESITSM